MGLTSVVIKARKEWLVECLQPRTNYGIGVLPDPSSLCEGVVMPHYFGSGLELIRIQTGSINAH